MIGYTIQHVARRALGFTVGKPCVLHLSDQTPIELILDEVYKDGAYIEAPWDESNTNHADAYRFSALIAGQHYGYLYFQFKASVPIFVFQILNDLNYDTYDHWNAMKRLLDFRINKMVSSFRILSA